MLALRSSAIAVALTLCFGPSTSLLVAQELVASDLPASSSSRESLRGLSGVHVQTSFAVDSEAATQSVDAESVRTFIESLLADANVPSVASRDASSRVAYLELEVGISTLIAGGERLGWAYVLNLQVLQEVCVEGLPRSSGCSVMPTWGTGTSQPTIVASDLMAALYGQVADAVDRFLRDYLKANPA